MLTFNKNYFAIAMIIFSVEVLIALYIKDSFIRPYVGDVLVVILLYCFVRSFLRLPVQMLAAGVLLFAFVVEFLQYFNTIEKLGLKESEIARIVMGTSFAWLDLLAYVIGICIVLYVEKYPLRKSAA